MSGTALPNWPSLLEFHHLRFLVMDAPTDANLPLYLKELQKHNVKHVVRACDPTYSVALLQQAGITVHDWSFPDGEGPPDSIVIQWLRLVHDVTTMNTNNAHTNKECIAVHCVAGLGRAPVLVAIALIEEGMEALDAVAFIRRRRRGAISSKQLKYIEAYKRRGNKGTVCVVM